jgi:hypothetical protein
MFGLWNAGDRDFAVLSEYADPAIELESPFSSVAGEARPRICGIERWTLDIDERFVQWSITPHEILEIDDRVIAMVTVSGRGVAATSL